MASMKYICLQNDLRYLWGAPGRMIEYMDEALGPRMVFERVPAGNGLMAYRSLEGGFWKVTRSGHVDLSAPDLEAASRFREVWFGDDRVGMLADNGCFVSVASWLKKGPVSVTTDAAGDDEKFWFEVPPVGLVPESTGHTAEKLVVEIGPKMTDSATLTPSVAVRESTTRIGDAVKGSDGVSASFTTRRRI